MSVNIFENGELKKIAGNAWDIDAPELSGEIFEVGEKTVAASGGIGHLNLVMKGYEALWLYAEGYIFSVFTDGVWWYARAYTMPGATAAPNGAEITFRYFGVKE